LKTGWSARRRSNVLGASASSVHADTAWTLAVRGVPLKTDISPKKSPFRRYAR
jgi:hypothetical protein